MGFRKGHGHSGSGKAVVIEVLPADELRKPNAEDIDARLDVQKAIGRPFVKGNRAARGRRPKLARLGLERSKGLDTKDPRYSSFLRQAESYRQRRVSEMKMTHGFVSVGAMSIIATASLQLAMSRFMMAVAADDMDTDMMKKASSLANDARQNELAAWELCQREAGAKARMSTAAAPWLTHKNPKVRVEEEEKSLEWEEAVLPEEAPKEAMRIDNKDGNETT